MMGFKERRSVAPHPGPLPKGEGENHPQLFIRPLLLMLKDKFPLRRAREALLDVIDHLAAQDGFSNPSANLAPNVRADFMAIFEVFCP